VRPVAGQGRPAAPQAGDRDRRGAVLGFERASAAASGTAVAGELARRGPQDLPAESAHGRQGSDRGKASDAGEGRDAMRATCWMGKRKLSVEQVPDPQIIN